MKLKVKFYLLICLQLFLFSCIEKKIEGASIVTENPEIKTKTLANSDEINALLDSLNIAAAQADFDKYFSFFAEGATYMGTDATENWDKESFKTWAKPYFDSKTTWNFKAVKRDIHFGEHDDIAWFEELLSTQMKICRGSGVLVKSKGQWKIQQYVLSMTVPNNMMDKVVKLKTPEEDSILNKLVLKQQTGLEKN